MLQIIEFLAFYILLPLMILAVIIFDVTLIRHAPGVALKVRSLGGLIGVSISVTVIFLDLSFGGLVHLPPVNSIKLWDVWMSLISAIVIGFLFLLFVDFLLRRGVVPFVILFTTATSIISPYYLISLSQSRELTSLGIVGFSTGWITYLTIFQNKFLSLMHEKLSHTDILEIKITSGNGIHINGNAMSGNILISDNAGGIIIKPSKSAKEVYVDLKQILNEIGKRFFKVSIAHPKLISKRFESPFVVQLYFEELADNVKAKIKEIAGENYTERVYDTELKFGQVIKIKLFSPDITFPEPIAKKLDSSINAMTFLGKPTDTCQPGEHKVVLSILDNKTGIEYQSETFSVKVVDFAFDHVSRPLLSRISAVVLGIGSFAMFMLTFLEQIDKTVGLTSGTATGVLAVAIYTGFYNLYQRVRPNTP